MRDLTPGNGGPVIVPGLAHAIDSIADELARLAPDGFALVAGPDVVATVRHYPTGTVQITIKPKDRQ